MDAVEHADGQESLPLGDSLEAKVLRFLRRNFETRTALQISKGVGLQTAKQVNPTLYSLEKKGLLHRIEKNKKPEWLAADNDYQMMPEIVDIHTDQEESGHVSEVIEEHPIPIRTKAQTFDPGDSIQHSKRHWEETRSTGFEKLNARHGHSDTTQEEDCQMDCEPTQPSSIGMSDQHKMTPYSLIGKGGLQKSTFAKAPVEEKPRSSNQVPTPRHSQQSSLAALPKAPHELLQHSTQVSEDDRYTEHTYKKPNLEDYRNKTPSLQRDISQQNRMNQQKNAPSMGSQFSSLPFHFTCSTQPQSVAQIGAQRVENQGTNEFDRIINFLKLFNRPVGTLEIAKAINKSTKKEVNKTLYDMQKQGIISKHIDMPPSWILCHPSTVRKQPERESESRHQFHGSVSNQQSLSPQAQQSSLPNQPLNRLARQGSWQPNAVQLEENHVQPGFNYVNADRSLMQLPHPMPSTTQQMHVPSMQQSIGLAIQTRASSASALPFASSASALPSASSASAIPSEISDISYAALNKNPISALNEYAQKNQIDLSFEVLNESRGGPNRFLVAVKMNGKMYNAASAGNTKDARREAADLALREILSKQVQSNASMQPNANQMLTNFDRIAMLSNQAFYSISANIQEKFAGRKVIAAIIMKSYSDPNGRVVSIGTGNRCITGDRLNLEGKTVNDSHAEIICRRAFLHFLYSEIGKFHSKKESLFENGGLNGRLQVKDGVTFHLYISTAPCGDGALFSPRDSATEDPSAVADAPRDHAPVFSSKQQGLLRTKIEDGEGTIPIDPNDGPQTWDGIVMGKRLRTMSCTDKVCRWNVLGLQGALLSHLIDPIYLETITLGYLYDHGHLSRAVCCRLQRNNEIDNNLPMPFYLNHPWLGRVTAYDPPRETEKTNNLSINWFEGCEGVEITDGRSGCCLTRSDNAPMSSRLCKASLYQHFKQICAKTTILHHLMEFNTYREAKEHAQDFQKAKQVMNKQFTDSRFGTWVKKPRELELFDVSNH
eukprot:gene16706-18400_t